MQLPDVKALRELLKLLRSQGVLQYQSTDLNLVLSETLPEKRGRQATPDEIMEEDEHLTAEQEFERMLFYSADKPVDPTPEQ
jgi:hypothetical protein